MSKKWRVEECRECREEMPPGTHGPWNVRDPGGRDFGDHPTWEGAMRDAAEYVARPKRDAEEYAARFVG